MHIKPYILECRDSIYEKLYETVYRDKLRRKIAADNEINKWHKYSELMFQWMAMKNKGYDLTMYLRKYQCRQIAVYGIGDMGKLCCDEILREGVPVLYIIDQSVQGEYKDIPIILPEYADDRVDAVIITPICYYLEIADILCDHTNSKLISLEDMVVTLNG